MSLEIAYYALAALVGSDILLTVYRVGQPRQPLTGLTAVCAIVQYGAIVALLILAGVNR